MAVKNQSHVERSVPRNVFNGKWRGRLFPRKEARSDTNSGRDSPRTDAQLKKNSLSPKKVVRFDPHSDRLCSRKDRHSVYNSSRVSLPRTQNIQGRVSPQSEDRHHHQASPRKGATRREVSDCSQEDSLSKPLVSVVILSDAPVAAEVAAEAEADDELELVTPARTGARQVGRRATATVDGSQGCLDLSSSGGKPELQSAGENDIMGMVCMPEQLEEEEGTLRESLRSRRSTNSMISQSLSAAEAESMGKACTGQPSAQSRAGHMMACGTRPTLEEPAASFSNKYGHAHRYSSSTNGIGSMTCALSPEDEQAFMRQIVAEADDDEPLKQFGSTKGYRSPRISKGAKPTLIGQGTRTRAKDTNAVPNLGELVACEGLHSNTKACTLPRMCEVDSYVEHSEFASPRMFNLLPPVCQRMLGSRTRSPDGKPRFVEVGRNRASAASQSGLYSRGTASSRPCKTNCGIETPRFCPMMTERESFGEENSILAFSSSLSSTVGDSFSTSAENSVLVTMYKEGCKWLRE